MIAVIIPAHNEAELLGACLDAVAVAAAHPGVTEDVHAYVVLDACTDGTRLVAKAHRTCRWVMTVFERNVGTARAAAGASALSAGAAWLAFTDADSRVPPDWLAAQMAERAAGADVVLGGCDVEGRPGLLDGKMCGANLGVSAEAYRRVGGFLPLETGEAPALVSALQASGARIVWMGPRVVTSGRLFGRAPGGNPDR